MSMKNVDVNEFGQLLGPRFHDSTVVGFSYEQGKDFSLTIKRLDGSRARFILVGVGPFGFGNFRDGAIINDVFAWEPERVPSDHLTEGGAWSVLIGEDCPLPMLESSIQRLKGEGFSYLVYIDPDFGGDFAALCHGLEVEEIARE
jgi:hypothetical protein